MHPERSGARYVLKTAKNNEGRGRGVEPQAAEANKERSTETKKKHKKRRKTQAGEEALSPKANPYYYLSLSESDRLRLLVRICVQGPQS